MLGAIAMVCLVGCSAQASSGQQGTFEGGILVKPPVQIPAEPFVLIFHDSNGDKDARYGLVTGRFMERAAWQRVYEHIGYLAPYAIYRPDHPLAWRLFDRHLALEAAQMVGRSSGASIFALPAAPGEEENLRRAYADPIGLSITHFFNDIEDNLGVPGGAGRWRARNSGDAQARLESAYSARFDMGIGRPMESCTVSFGVTADDHIFGGQPQILEMRTQDGASWSISFVNEGGLAGTNQFVVTGDQGEKLASPPMNAWLGRQWHDVSVAVDGFDASDHVRVTLSVQGLEAVARTMSRSLPGKRRLSIGSSSTKPLWLDDLVISAQVDGRPHMLARYTFESPGPDRPAMHRVEDDSGNGHALTAPSGFQFFPTSGADPEIYAQHQKHLVHEMLAPRERAGAPAPEVLTNWRLSEQPGRLAAYRPAGFTHGNTVYYLYEPPAGMGTLESIFLDGTTALMTQWAWDDGSPWSTVWIGNVHPEKAVLEPEEYPSLISLAVLEGNRYFVVFTGMSEGHLGRAGLSQSEAANLNADAFYGMAETASWFQSSSGTLRASRYLGDAPLLDRSEGVIFRARGNDATGELWFAGLAPKGSKHARVRLPAARGTLVNLATGEEEFVTDGLVTIPFDQLAEPYHFKPTP